MTAKSTDLSIEFTLEKETPGTIRYKETVDEASPFDGPVIGTLYVKKYAAAKLGNPEKLTVTLKVA